jgi:hypothetical protein
MLGVGERMLFYNCNSKQGLYAFNPSRSIAMLWNYILQFLNFMRVGIGQDLDGTFSE